MTLELITIPADLSKVEFTENEWKELLDQLQEQMQNCLYSMRLDRQNEKVYMRRWHEIGALFEKCYDYYYAKFKLAIHGPLN